MVARSRIHRSASYKLFSALIAAIILAMVVITLYPFYYILIVSLSSGRAVMRHEVTLWIKEFTTQSYLTVLREPYLLTSLRNTLVYTLVGTGINLVMTMLCAYPLAQPDTPGKKLFMAIIVFTMFFSGGMIPAYMVVRDLKMLNTIWALVLPGAISTYNMIIMRTFFQGIPRELHESAYLDGASELSTLTHIVLPLSLPIIATMILFYAVGHWNSYLSAAIYLDRKSLYPVQVILRNIVIDGDTASMLGDMNSGSDFAAIDTTIKYAIIMVAAFPILMIYPFLQKYFVKGVMIGSLKG
jgi:putative aldouronate transport system permease protein